MEALSWDIFLITMDIYGTYLKLVFMYSHGAYLKKTCWWYTYPSEKYEFVSWDDDIPN